MSPASNPLITRRSEVRILPPLLKSLKASHLWLAFFVFISSRRETSPAVARKKRGFTTSGVMMTSAYFGVQLRVFVPQRTEFSFIKPAFLHWKSRSSRLRRAHSGGRHD